MQMTVSEALDYVQRATGMEYTEELNNKVLNFLEKLPRHPCEVRYDGSRTDITIRDYDYGWFVTVLVMNDKGKMLVKVVDADNLDPNPNRVKTNTEALALLQEYNEIKYAIDIDKHWNMSDDHKYWRKMSELNDRAFAKADEIERKLD